MNAPNELLPPAAHRGVPAAMLATERPDGTSAFAGYRVTGFTNAEEAQAGLADNAPWLLQDRLKTLGTEFSEGEPWAPNVIVSSRTADGR